MSTFVRGRWRKNMLTASLVVLLGILSSSSASAGVVITLWIAQDDHLWKVNGATGSYELLAFPHQDTIVTKISALSGSAATDSWQIFGLESYSDTKHAGTNLWWYPTSAAGACDGMTSGDCREPYEISGDHIDWTGTTKMIFGKRLNGQSALWLIRKTDNMLYRAAPSYLYSREGAVALSPGWAGATSIAYCTRDDLGDRVLVIADEQLWSVADNGNVTSLGRGWGGPTMMTGVGNYLYTVQADTLWRVHPRNGTYVRLGPVGAWVGATSMTSTYDRLYIIQGGYLYSVTLDGVWTQLGGQAWPGPTAMTASYRETSSVKPPFASMVPGPIGAGFVP